MSKPSPPPRPNLRAYKFLAGCLLAVASARLALSVLGYRRMREPPVRTHRIAPADLVARVRAGVTWAARLVPGATCLTQAVACRQLIGRHGFPTILRVGVRPDSRGGFTAHAWLFSGDEVVVGGAEPELQGYAALADLRARSK